VDRGGRQSLAPRLVLLCSIRSGWNEANTNENDHWITLLAFMGIRPIRLERKGNSSLPSVVGQSPGSPQYGTDSTPLKNGKTTYIKAQGGLRRHILRAIIRNLRLLFSKLTASTTGGTTSSKLTASTGGDNFLQVNRISYRGPLCLRTRKLHIYGPCL
jgi:hypothetical protein